MVKLEIFDAYDEQGNKLGIDLIRGQLIPKGLYHYIVEIYTLNQYHECLVTLRDDKLYYPHYWEITAGAVLKGEKPIDAAMRELSEETGLLSTVDSLKELFIEKHNNCFIFGFIHRVDSSKQTIHLQVNETIDYQWIPLVKMTEFTKRKDFVPTCAKRLYQYYSKILDFDHCR